MKNKIWSTLLDVIKTAIGCALFALGFDLFLMPGGMNAGGLSGLAMILVHVTGLGTVGVVSALMNVPLFILGGMKIGKKFFLGSLMGMLFSSVFIDLFAALPVPQVEPMIGALYGGLVCGIGLGFVFAAGVSTALLLPKTTRNTQGVAVVSLKKKAVVTDVMPLEESGIVNQSRYRSKNIPTAGAILKEEDSPEKQITLEM